MALDENNRARLDEFFGDIARHSSAYQQDMFSYVALRDGERWVIVVGSLIMHAAAPTMAERSFECAVAKAGVFRLASLNLSPAEFVAKLADGMIQTPHGELEFPAVASASPPRHAVNYIPYNPIGNQARLDTAQIMGEQCETLIRQPMLDWALRGASSPYDGLGDLIVDFGLPQITPAISVHLIAQCAAMIDASSRVEGGKATLILALASGLDSTLAAAGVLVWNQRVLDRRHISSEEFSWRQEAGRQVGEVTLDVPVGAALHCFASYAGIAHHRYWVADPSMSQNARRATFEGVGLSVKSLADLIADARADRGIARRFEGAVASLLWLLGFSPAHLGDAPSTQEAPDILVATPSGHVALVECTTGMVKQDKLLNLRARANAVRQRLDASNLRALRVLPVLACARPEADVEPERAAAAGMGICILDGDDLIGLLDRTALVPDADRYFAEAEEAVAQRNGANSGGAPA